MDKKAREYRWLYIYFNRFEIAGFGPLHHANLFQAKIGTCDEMMVTYTHHCPFFEHDDFMDYLFRRKNRQGEVEVTFILDKCDFEILTPVESLLQYKYFTEHSYPARVFEQSELIDGRRWAITFSYHFTDAVNEILYGDIMPLFERPNVNRKAKLISRRQYQEDQERFREYFREKEQG